MIAYTVLTSLSILSLVAAEPATCTRQIWPYTANFCSGPPEIYNVYSSQGKGLGVFAAHDLDTGEFIIREQPALKIIPPEFVKGSGYPMGAITELVRNGFEALSTAEQDEIMSLAYYATAAEEATMDRLGIIFRNNAYNSGKEVGLFPKIARINHSCRPNASYYWSDALNKRIVYTTRKLKKGEEIFVSYISLLLTQEDRQRQLDRYGFKCTCDACAQEHAAKEASDNRRVAIHKAFIEFEPQLTLTLPGTKKTREQARKNAKLSLRLTDLVYEEGLADYYAKAYRVAAICHARVKDWENAAIWANKAYELKVLEDPHSIYTMEMHNLTSTFIASWEKELSKKPLRPARL
jgi:hypothetical protein